LEITPWIEWFLGVLSRAIDDSLDILKHLLNKSKFWEEIGKASINERQKKLLNMLFNGFKGKLTTSKWAQIAKCSQDTAHRDIASLIDKRILVKDSAGGRSSSYSLSRLGD
jgi:Fic family protein